MHVEVGRGFVVCIAKLPIDAARAAGRDVELGRAVVTRLDAHCAAPAAAALHMHTQSTSDFLLLNNTCHVFSTLHTLFITLRVLLLRTWQMLFCQVLW